MNVFALNLHSDSDGAIDTIATPMKMMANGS
jgi:hypothetical protein